MRPPVLLAVAVLTCAILLTGCGSDDTSDSSNSDKSTTTTERDDDASKDFVSQSFNASGLFAGDANPALEDGDPGKVAVVAQAPLALDKDYGDATLTFAFRNNTNQTLSDVDWSATARVDGELVATGSSQSTVPALIGPGEIGLSYIYFDGGTDIPEAGATYEFTPDPREADDESFGNAPLIVDEINRKGDTVVGAATNESGRTLSGPYAVEAFCFTGDDITGWGIIGFAEEDADIETDASVHFTEQLVGDCKTYALAVSGHFE